MTTDANKEIARRWLQAVSEGDEAAFRACMTEDGVHELMGSSVLAGERTVDEVAGLAQQLHAATKNGLTLEILNVTAEDDRVAVELVGSSELVNGTPYNNVYNILFHFRDGKLCRVREYADSKIVDEAVGPLLAGAS